MDLLLIFRPKTSFSKKNQLFLLIIIKNKKNWKIWKEQSTEKSKRNILKKNFFLLICTTCTVIRVSRYHFAPLCGGLLWRRFSFKTLSIRYWKTLTTMKKYFLSHVLRKYLRFNLFCRKKVTCFCPLPTTHSSRLIKFFPAC